MLKILGRKTSGNVQKVVWLCEEAGIAYGREDYGRQFGNTGDDAYLGMNPTGKIPTLVDDEVVVWESNTILRYLANAHDTSLYPGDAAARSRVERWMDWQLASLNAPYMTIFRETRKPPEERKGPKEEEVAALNAELSILDGALQKGGPWIAGAEMSLADICLGPIVHRCLDFKIDQPELGRLRAWREAVTARPAFQTAVG